MKPGLYIEKAAKWAQVPGHQYIERTGEPGHYKYRYSNTRQAAARIPPPTGYGGIDARHPYWAEVSRAESFDTEKELRDWLREQFAEHYPDVSPKVREEVAAAVPARHGAASGAWGGGSSIGWHIVGRTAPLPPDPHGIMHGVPLGKKPAGKGVTPTAFQTQWWRNWVRNRPPYRTASELRDAIARFLEPEYAPDDRVVLYHAIDAIPVREVPSGGVGSESQGRWVIAAPRDENRKQQLLPGVPAAPKEGPQASEKANPRLKEMRAEEEAERKQEEKEEEKRRQEEEEEEQRRRDEEEEEDDYEDEPYEPEEDYEDSPADPDEGEPPTPAELEPLPESEKKPPGDRLKKSPKFTFRYTSDEMRVAKEAGRIFGREISEGQLAQIASIPSAYPVAVSAYSGAIHIDAQIESAENPGRNWGWSRVIKEDRAGRPYVYNDHQFLPPEMRGGGFATKNLYAQALQCHKLGIGQIRCTAGGSRHQSMNGYYTWPRLGFDGRVPYNAKRRAKEEFPNLPSGFTVRDIFMQESGAEWWKENGDQFEAHFNTHPNSRSMRVLRAYLKEKGMQPPELEKARKPDDNRKMPRGEHPPDLDERDDAILKRIWDRIGKLHRDKQGARGQDRKTVRPGIQIKKAEAAGAERPGHKYIRREGGSGHYRYFYRDPQGREYSSDKPPAGGGAQGELPGMEVKPETAELPDYKLTVTGAGAKDTADKLGTGIKQAADLCQINPPLCKDNLGIARENMPQLTQDVADKFLHELVTRGVKIESTSMPVGKMKATQREINAEKVNGMVGAVKSGKLNLDHGELIVSKDGYILDGHHRWAALAMMDPGKEVKVQRVDLDMHSLLAESLKHPGVTRAGFGVMNKAEGAIPGLMIVVQSPAPAPAEISPEYSAMVKPLSREQRHPHPFGGTIELRGLPPIDIENRAGSTRHCPDGDFYQHYHYGEFRHTEGEDGDPVDVFVGSHPAWQGDPGKQAWIVHQCRPDTGQYDEDKVMVGFGDWVSEDHIRNCYLRQYDDVRFWGGASRISLDELGERLKSPSQKGEMILPWDGEDGIAKARKPPSGNWEAIPKGRHGGYRKRTGKAKRAYEYWYPGQPSLRAEHGWEAHPNKGSKDAKPGDLVFIVGSRELYRLTPEHGPKEKERVWVHSLTSGEYQQVIKGKVRVARRRGAPSTTAGKLPRGGKPLPPPPPPPPPLKPKPTFTRPATAKFTKMFKESRAEEGTVLWNIEHSKYQLQRHKDADRKKQMWGVYIPPKDHKQFFEEFKPMIFGAAMRVGRNFGIRLKDQQGGKTIAYENLLSAATMGVVMAAASYTGAAPFVKRAWDYARTYALNQAKQELGAGVNVTRRQAILLRGYLASKSKVWPKLGREPTRDDILAEWTVLKPTIFAGKLGRYTDKDGKHHYQDTQRVPIEDWFVLDKHGKPTGKKMPGLRTLSKATEQMAQGNKVDDIDWLVFTGASAPELEYQHLPLGEQTAHQEQVERVLAKIDPKFAEALRMKFGVDDPGGTEAPAEEIADKLQVLIGKPWNTRRKAVGALLGVALAAFQHEAKKQGADAVAHAAGRWSRLPGEAAAHAPDPSGRSWRDIVGAVGEERAAILSAALRGGRGDWAEDILAREKDGKAGAEESRAVRQYRAEQERKEAVEAFHEHAKTHPVGPAEAPEMPGTATTYAGAPLPEDEPRGKAPTGPRGEQAAIMLETDPSWQKLRYLQALYQVERSVPPGTAPADVKRILSTEGIQPREAWRRPGRATAAAARKKGKVRKAVLPGLRLSV